MNSETFINIIHETFNRESARHRTRRAFHRERSNTPWLNQPFSLVSIGKAATSMASGIADQANGNLKNTLLISCAPYWLTLGREFDGIEVECVNGSHPIADSKSLHAGQRLLQFVKRHSHEPIVFAISGGGSAMVESLPDSITLEQWQSLNRALLSSDPDIVFINEIRRSLSQIKNGGLCQFCDPKQTIQFSLYDVPDDDPCLLASGLLFARNEWLNKEQHHFIKTYCPNFTYQEPVIESNNDWHQVNVGNSETLAEQFSEALHQGAGIQKPSLFEFNCDVDRMVNDVFDRLQRMPSGLVVGHGEMTIALDTMNPSYDENTRGVGGRHTHFLLSLAQKLRDVTFPYFVASIATDGRDGSAPCAGGFIDNAHVNQLQNFSNAADGDPVLQLARFNSYTPLKAINSTLHLTPGMNNVRDILIFGRE